MDLHASHTLDVSRFWVCLDSGIKFGITAIAVIPNFIPHGAFQNKEKAGSRFSVFNLKWKKSKGQKKKTFGRETMVTGQERI